MAGRGKAKGMSKAEERAAIAEAMKDFDGKVMSLPDQVDCRPKAGDTRYHFTEFDQHDLTPSMARKFSFHQKIKKDLAALKGEERKQYKKKIGRASLRFERRQRKVNWFQRQERLTNI